MSLFRSHLLSPFCVILEQISRYIAKGVAQMKHNVQNLRLILGQLDRRRVRIGLAVLTLALFVLGAGAPAIGGGS
jgi:hypothetical protein